MLRFRKIFLSVDEFTDWNKLPQWTPSGVDSIHYLFLFFFFLNDLAERLPEKAHAKLNWPTVGTACSQPSEGLRFSSTRVLTACEASTSMASNYYLHRDKGYDRILKSHVQL